MKDKYIYLYLPLTIITSCFIMWSPEQLMITDELSYYFQSKWWTSGQSVSVVIDSISNQNNNLIAGQYPQGTSIILSLLSLVSDNLIFYAGYIYLLSSVLILYRCLKIFSLPKASISVLYLFIPLIFLSRTTMSEMPSLLLVSIGVYLFMSESKNSDNKKNSAYLWLALITGLSISFRETNLLLLAPMAFFISRNYLFSFLGFALGASFRFATYFIATGNAFFVKEGYPFGVSFIIDNLWIYAFVLIVFLPLSPLWFTRLSSNHRKVFMLSLLSFLGLHLLYGYRAYVYSGFINGFILNGRFWIPALPIFVIALSYFLKGKNWIQSAFSKSVITILIIGINLAVHYKSNLKKEEYQQFSSIIKSHCRDQITYIDMDYSTSIYRYVYPFIKDYNWSDINSILEEQHIEKTWVDNEIFKVIIIESFGSSQKSKRHLQSLSIIEDLSKKHKVVSVVDKCISSSNCLKIYEVRR